jgi:hypothetical protein
LARWRRRPRRGWVGRTRGRDPWLPGRLWARPCGMGTGSGGAPGLAAGMATPRRRRGRGIRLFWDRGPGQSGWAGVPRRPRLWWPGDFTLLWSDRERQPRSARIPNVDALAVMDVNDRRPVPVDVRPVQRVVDCQPPALIEPQYQVRTGDPRVGNAQVGVQVTTDDHLVACRERTLGPVVPNCQDRRGGSSHYSSIGPRLECAP